MSTVFADETFLKCELFTMDNSRSIICTLRDPASGRFEPDLLRQIGRGFLNGRMVSPANIPNWLESGSILKLDSIEQSFKAILTYQPTAQSRINRLRDILGDKVRFSYVVVTEFKDV